MSNYSCAAEFLSDIVRQLPSSGGGDADNVRQKTAENVPGCSFAAAPAGRFVSK